MYNKRGTALMVLGALLVLSALGLFLWNQREAHEAGQAADLVLPQLLEQIPTSPRAASTPQPEPTGETLLPDNALVVPTDPAMTEAQIGGYGYIGCLTIPALDLELPVMGQLDDTRLKTAPCRYAGSTKTGDLVIGGHNYVQHFAYLSRLTPGDPVYFLDMDGVLSAYQVAAVEVLRDTAVAEMTSGDFALTLFTCTYGGGSRIAVRCDRTSG